MICELTTAREYQDSFNAGLLFLGFEDGILQWMGTDRQHQQAKINSLKDTTNEDIEEKTWGYQLDDIINSR